MKNKTIFNISQDDFVGSWSNSQNIGISVYLKVYSNLRAFLKVGTKNYEGRLSIEYIEECDDCTNCLCLYINEERFYVKQIADDGFYLTTTETGEIHLSRQQAN